MYSHDFTGSRSYLIMSEYQKQNFASNNPQSSTCLHALPHMIILQCIFTLIVPGLVTHSHGCQWP